MEDIKVFFEKNKATIISVLSALLTFVIALSKIEMGAKVGIVVSILLVVIPFLISVVSGADMETNIKLLVNAITVIQQIIKNQNKSEEIANQVVGATKDVLDLTEEEIKELIVKDIK
jgi:hypothetical protein